MTNDSITRLLYAILSQKCLKDIDWNKVAHDPILSQEITNGHAARMRYSRFKKQMDGGTAAARQPRAPSTPRKPRVEKNKSPNKKIKDRKLSDDDERIKQEVGKVGSSHHTERTPEAGVDSQDASPIVKREPSLQAGYPLTPMGSQSHTPSPSFPVNMREMDEMMVSFGPPMPGQGLAGDQAMYPDVRAMAEGHGYPMGMQMGMQNPYLWHQAQSQGEGEGALVKPEPRWEETYHHQC